MKVTHALSKKYSIPLNYFRKMEKFNHKVIKIECDIAYLNKCLQLDLIPKFLHLKDPNTLLNEQLLKSRQIKKINQLIKSHRAKLKTVWLHRSNSIAHLKEQLSTLDYFRFYRILIKSNCQFRSNTTERHNKKMKHLWLSKNVTVPQYTINNLSGVQLDENQLELLKTGLRQPYHPSKKDFINLQVDVEKALTSMKTTVSYQLQNELKCKLITYGKRLLNHAKSEAAKYKQQIVKTLRDNPDIKVLPYDKGNGIAIMTHNDYVKKMKVLLTIALNFNL